MSLFIDLTSAPYNVVANDPSKGADNTTGINQAIVDGSALAAASVPTQRVSLNLPKGDIYVGQAQPGNENWSIKFGSGIKNVELCGEGPVATTLVQDGTGDVGDWACMNFDLCSNIRVANLGLRQGIIKKPDPGQQNHLVAFYNTATMTPQYTENIDFDNVLFGKCIGDAFAMRSGINYPVRRVRLSNFRMNLAGSSIQDWKPATAYAAGEQVHNLETGSNQKRYQAVVSGTSAGTQPTSTGFFTFADIAVTFAAGTDRVTATSHGLVTGDGPVKLAAVSSVELYVIRIDANTFQLALNALDAHGGSAIDIISNGSGTLEDTTETRHTFSDNTVVWQYQAAGTRLAARAGITFQGGYQEWEVSHGVITGARNSPIDMESSATGLCDGVFFHHLLVDNAAGITALAAQFGSASTSNPAKNLRIQNCTFLAGGVEVISTENCELSNCTSIITTTLLDNPGQANFTVRANHSDLRLLDLDVQRLGGTAAACLDVEGSPTTPNVRMTIHGGRFVQGTAKEVVLVNGVSGLVIDGAPRLHYKSATDPATLSLSAMVVASSAQDSSDLHVDSLEVRTDTGTFRGGLELQGRAGGMSNISVRGIRCAGEAAYAVILNVLAGATFDANPIIEACDAGTAGVVWRQEDANNNPVTSMFPIVSGSKGKLSSRLVEGAVSPEGVVIANLGDSFLRHSGDTVVERWTKVLQGVAGTPSSSGWSQNDDDRGNLVRNSGFWFAQRQSPGSATTYSNTSGRAQCADGWGITNQNASAQYQRVDTQSTPETNLRSRFYGTFTKITSTGKLVVSQAIEGSDTSTVRGRTVRLQAKLKGTASQTLRFGLAQLTTLGTIDSLPATFVSAFGANGTDPTFGANISLIAPRTGAPAENATVTGSALDCAVTTGWTRFGGLFDIPANAKNLIVLVWSNAQLTTTNGFSLSEVSLTNGVELQIWAPAPFEYELRRVQRYFQKTFAVDTAPAQNVGINTGELTGGLWKAGASSAAGFLQWRLPVRLRAAPTATTYNPAAASAQMRQIGGTAANLTSTSTGNLTDSSVDISATGVSTGTVGDKVGVHVVADAEL